MKPILENLLLAHQLVQMLRVVAGHAAPEHMVMRTLHDRERIDLHIPQMLDGAVRPGRAGAHSELRCQALFAECQASQFGCHGVLDSARVEEVRRAKTSRGGRAMRPEY